MGACFSTTNSGRKNNETHHKLMKKHTFTHGKTFFGGRLNTEYIFI